MPMGNRKLLRRLLNDHTLDQLRYKYTVYDNGGERGHGRNAFDGGGMVTDTGTGLRWQ
jgi:hypothetical protein